MLDCMIIFALLLFNYRSSPLISLDDVELVIEGDIENDEYITNAMEAAIEKYYTVSILMHFYIHIIINYFIINNIFFFFFQMNA